jgi:hypothetical protein
MPTSTNILTCFLQLNWMLLFYHASMSICIWFTTTKCLLPNLTHQNVPDTFLQDTSRKMNKDSKLAKDIDHCMLKCHFSMGRLRDIVLWLKDARRRLITTHMHIVKRCWKPFSCADITASSIHHLPLLESKSYLGYPSEHPAHESINISPLSWCLNMLYASTSNRARAMHM